MSSDLSSTQHFGDFDNLLADLLSRQDAGEPIDRDQLLKDHPEFATELLAFLDDLALIDGMRSPPTPSPSDTIAEFSSPLVLPCRFGDYELLEEIARGGMGIVYKARQYLAGDRSKERPFRLVALKMVRETLLATPEKIRRFRSEVQAVAVLDHPNIVPFFEVGEHHGHPFYTMKLIEGGSLADSVIRGRWPMGNRDAYRRTAELIAT